ncbi:MAG: hypothetical protein H8D23_19385 [Candidatus Brocadiales bacterium]|nr:hypothetical protein [Candidatus Brocadiales bacterium]
MSKYDKEYCGKSIRVMYKYIALCILAMVVSYVSVRYFCAKPGIFYRIMNGVAGIAIGISCLFIWGSLIEIVKCRNILKELKETHRGNAENAPRTESAPARTERYVRAGRTGSKHKI